MDLLVAAHFAISGKAARLVPGEVEARLLSASSLFAAS